MFRSVADLKAIYPKLVSHSMQNFGAKEVMNFLGKKRVGNFRGEVVSDMTDRCNRRLPGMRVKHRAKMNWIKMYDKAGSVLRVETVINEPEAFKVRNRAGQPVKAFNPASNEDQRIFKSLLSSANTINGFRNRDLRLRLANSPLLRSCVR